MGCCSEDKQCKKSIWRSPFTWTILFLVGFWLYNYHLEHALGFLPYAILLLCPLMHIFMHGGHGGHGDHNHEEKSDNEDPSKSQNFREDS